MNRSIEKGLIYTNPLAICMGVGAFAGVILRRLYLALAIGVVKDMKRLTK